MDVVNAISKVRFSSSGPQWVRLHAEEHLDAQLLCMEPDQKATVRRGVRLYYVVTGSAELSDGDGPAKTLSPGEMAAPTAEGPHTLANAGRDRLVCLAIGCSC